MISKGKTTKGMFPVNFALMERTGYVSLISKNRAGPEKTKTLLLFP